MNKNEVLESIRGSLVNLDFENSKKYTQEAMEIGVDPQDVILKSIAQGIEIVGKKFEASEYFLSELIAAGEIGKELTAILAPKLQGTKMKTIGKVVLGTVRGDLHDIGKNIVAMMLQASQFEVIDLGADVSPERFIESIAKEKADIIGMSALLTVTMQEMKAVVDQLKDVGLRGRVKVMIGGAAVTEEFAKEIGADAYGATAVDAVGLCKRWVA